ncbi:hypothetical protein Tco_0589323 [Tanacetum coccineum]
MEGYLYHHLIHKYAKLTTLVPTYGDPDLASRDSALEQVCANFEKRHKIQDNTVQGLSSKVFTLELRDLPHKIDETINEAVKEAIQIVLQAPLKEHFRDLSEADMKEIIHDRMFESGTYRSQPEHVALYEALEASIERDNRDEFLAKKDKSSKQKSIPHSEQLVKEVPIVDDVNISDSEDTDTAHLPKIKTRPDWLKLVPEEDRPKTPEPDWIGKSKLSKADLEGPAYKVVRAFHLNIISLQFQMEECRLLLTDKIDLVNPKGNRLVPNVGKPLSLGGPLGQIRNIVIRKHMEDLQLGIESYQTKLNLTQLDYDSSDFLFKEDHTIVRKPRAVIYKDKNDQKKMMREIEVHKFSDGTLTRILEKLYHMVKNFMLFKYNPGMESRIWSEDDKRTSKDFMEVIERRLKIRRIFRSLKSFVSGRLRDVDYILIQQTE